MMPHTLMGGVSTNTINTTALTSTVAKSVVTKIELVAAMGKADTAYKSSRENAATAAATVYYVWFHSASSYAAPQNAAWFDGEVAKRQAEIEAHNADLDALKKQDEKELKKKLKPLLDNKTKANDPMSIAGYEREMQALKNESNAHRKDLTAKRMVKLESRSDATKWTFITKFVLRLHDPKQASQVSRFATVVKWIAAKFPLPAAPDIAAIAKTILDDGGFETVYDLQRAIDGKTTDGKETDSTDSSVAHADGDSAAKEAVTAHLRQAISAADGLGVIKLEREHAQNSFVALIGRVGPDGITIVSDIGMPVADLLHLCVQHDTNLLPGDAASEFVATALAAGELVEESKRLGKDGATVEVTRELTILSDINGATLIVSPLNTEVSIVVHAEPKGPAASALLSKHGNWRLHHPDLAKLTERLSNDIERKLMTTTPNEEKREVGENSLTSELAWVSTNGLLPAKGDAAATVGHAWLSMSPYEPTPLDIEGFTPLGCVDLSRDELTKLVQGRIGKWATEKQGSKIDGKLAAFPTVVISKSEIKVGTTQGHDVAMCTGYVKKKFERKFRPRMLAKLLHKLADLGADTYKFEPDDRGVLRASFENKHGRYSIYLPACDKDGALEKARFCQIRVADEDDE